MPFSCYCSREHFAAEPLEKPNFALTLAKEMESRTNDELPSDAFAQISVA